MSGSNGHYTDPFFNTSDDYSTPYSHSGQSSPYEPMFPQHIDSTSSLSAPFSGTGFNIIMSASHDTLMRSGNVAYTSVHAQFVKARCDLEAERNTVARLQKVIETLAMSRAMSRRNSRPSPMPGALASEHNRPPTETLNMPGATEDLDQDDYPDVPYWHESDWTKHCNRQRDRGQTISKLSFLTNKGGSPVSESRIKEFMATAKEAWNELYRHHHDPITWMKKASTASTYFAREMKIKFPEFAYCEGNWKAEKFAIVKYPDWCRDSREGGQLIRARPSLRPPKRKASSDNHEKVESKKKKKKAKHTMPPDVQVIDLDNDIPNNVAVVHPPTAMTGLTGLVRQSLSPLSSTDVATAAPTPTRPATTPHAASTTASAASPAETGLVCPSPSPQSDLSSAGMAPAASAPTHPAPTPHAASTTANTTSPTDTGLVRPSPSPQPDLSSAGVAPTVPTPTCPAPTPDAASTTASATSPTETGLTASTTTRSDGTPVDTLDVSSSPAPPLSNISTPLDTSNPLASPAADSAPTSQVNGSMPQSSVTRNAGQRSGRRRVNLLVGMSIPKPSIQVPSEAPAAASSVVVQSTGRGSKSEKVMAATPGLLTARNLFAIDYLQHHTLSKSEFKIKWDTIDPETKKKYETLSKQKKLAALIASTAAPPVSNGDSNTA